MYGKVRWFDKMRGEGIVRGENGKNYSLHWSVLPEAQTPGNTKNYNAKTKNWVTIEKGTPVIFEADIDDEYDRMVTKLEKCKKEHP
jgi:cold shock CspA family protein